MFFPWLSRVGVGGGCGRPRKNVDWKKGMGSRGKSPIVLMIIGRGVVVVVVVVIVWILLEKLVLF